MSTMKGDSIRTRLMSILGGGQSAEAEDKDKAPPTETETDAEADEPADDAEKPAGDPVETDEDGEPKKDDEDEPEMAASAVAAERSRWATVMRSDAAVGRMDLAVDLLADSDMGADKILAAIGKVPAAKASTDFGARMASEGDNPKITATDGGDAPAPTVASVMAARYAKKEK